MVQNVFGSPSAKTVGRFSSCVVTPQSYLKAVYDLSTLARRLPNFFLLLCTTEGFDDHALIGALSMTQDLSRRNDWISYIRDFSYSLLPELQMH